MKNYYKNLTFCIPLQTDCWSIATLLGEPAGYLEPFCVELAMKMSKYSMSSNTGVDIAIICSTVTARLFPRPCKQVWYGFSNTNVATGQNFRALLRQNMSLSNNIYFDYHYASAFYVFEELHSDLENLEKKIFFHFPSKKLNLNSILFFLFFSFFDRKQLNRGYHRHRQSSHQPYERANERSLTFASGLKKQYRFCRLIERNSEQDAFDIFHTCNQK